ncbi:chemotaxis response regulator protein-glutamate methylesterase [Gilvimarinus sp. SDUM040013]|uniref:Protein-glutamate methylesterase/protein-glutamine glutaminase n=1 Tax=Gilvimarinus gilvus TaxID=3058038 RepID=A0ABU4RU56_9GAMM|nr:chemotaxis response regulator protein-glutamate methylesterase [Gilvimarinus sp. SDUM040013]MDO3385038.1 chemotaxis response regulator protein-glutamate methylesterase [Gilvimarinus sp. SDUM040013]MDX6848413.1 chemotaxis response regulator protein-glutamate methylesterase [Gilvimarinus sp. SDUM040013]
MPVRVMIVDDSHFFQTRLKEIIGQNANLQVVAVASNGREAIDLVAKVKPDIITMDFEMPVMDGVTAVKHIMASDPTPILMFSSLTYEGARITLDALAAGALDFIPKDFAEVSRNSVSLTQKLHERLLTLARQGSSKEESRAPQARPSSPQQAARPHQHPQQRPVEAAQRAVAPSNPPAPRKKFSKPKLLVIGASTGGPVALTEVLTKLPRNLPLPILLVQHMPENFTKAFAERLNKQCAIEVREAVDGDVLRPGVALLAPGGKQMMVDPRGASVKVMPDDDRVNYKPSLDITFGSAANSFTDRVLGVVLTGMGSDGCKGAELLKQKGAQIWSQDEASCVIYGMPMAVARANLTDRVLALKDIGPALADEVS